MTETMIITSLRTKRDEIFGALELLGRQVERHRAELTHLDATIRLFDPDAEAAAPGPKGPARKRNDWFRPGECRRRIHDVLRDAAAPMTTREIVAAVMAVKALPATNLRTRELIHKTVLSSLNRAADTVGRVEVSGSAAWRAL
jgi:hypothetical protein